MWMNINSKKATKNVVNIEDINFNITNSKKGNSYFNITYSHNSNSLLSVENTCFKQDSQKAF